MAVQTTWWKDAIVYQIWPASYKDSNGDGIGDIPGIISTLDYIHSLGVNVIWLSPMYDSPQDDMGYDISDYQSVYPKYGTMEDMDNLIRETHKRGMKLILDLVINHTSDQHEWFKESRSSKTNPKRDWYIWKPPRYDEQGNRLLPNDWKSCFSGSAWEYDELTGEYYLHIFAKSQPDLNWEIERNRLAIYESAVTYWYEKGIDGFRIDMCCLYSKDFENNVVANGPRIHEFHKEMFNKVTSKYDVMTVGEVGGCSRYDALKYVSAKEKELNMVFLFDVVEIGTAKGNRYDYVGYSLPDFKKAIESQSDFIKDTDAWSTVFIENHDQPRSVSRFGNVSNPKYHNRSAKLLAMLQTTLTGTLFIYQGQEIGMTNVPKSWSIDEYQDIQTINYYNEFSEKYGDDKEKIDKLMYNFSITARDHARTPVQWDDSENAGFSTGKPWTRINDNYKTINVASQTKDLNSIFSFWQKALKVRKNYSSLLNHGNFKILDFDNEKLFTYMKEMNGEQAYIVLNFSNETIKFEKLIEGSFELVLSNVDIPDEDSLTPYEGRLYMIN